MNIVKATVKHIDQITPLFDAYRQSYSKPGEPVTADYLRARLDNNEATVFMAYQMINVQQDLHYYILHFVQLK